MAALDTLQLLVDLDSSGLESKINSTVSSVTKAFEKFEGLDFNKLLSGLDSVNWTSIVGKLFSPANLIAFFSAMAATGIIASIQQQATIGGAPGTGELTGGAGGSTAAGIISAAQQIADTTGQSTTDIETAIESLIPALGDNVDAANSLGLQIAEVANASGTTASTVAAIFAPFLQVLGVTDLKDASSILQSLGNSAAQANTPIQDLIQSYSAFAPEVKIANLNQAGLNNTMQQFGASVEGAGLPGATAAFQTLFDVLTGANEGAVALGAAAGGVGKLKAEVEDGNTAGALNDISTAVKGLLENGQLTLVGGQFDLTAAGISALEGNLTKYPIDTQQTIQSLFASSVTPMTKFNEALQTLENTTSKTFGNGFVNDFLVPTITGLTWLLQNSTNVLGFFDKLAGDVGGLAGSALGAVEGNPVSSSILNSIPFIGPLLQGLNSLRNTVQTSQSSSANSSANVKVTVSSAPGTTASVSTQQNGVNGLLSTAGTPSSSNVTVTNK
jgi:hypothetical protein